MKALNSVTRSVLAIAAVIGTGPLAAARRSGNPNDIRRSSQRLK